MIMGVQRWGLRCGLLAIIQIHAFAQDQSGLTQDSVPFSNPEYVCRCLPMADAPVYQGLEVKEVFALHKDLCELKMYVRSLQGHVNLLTSFFNGDTRDVATWFDESYKRLNAAAGRKKDDGLLAWLEQRRLEIGNKGLLLKGDVYREVEKLPVANIAAKLQTNTVRAALLDLKAKQSYEALSQCWQALNAFAYCDGTDLSGLEKFNQFFAADLQGDTSMQTQRVCAYKAIKDLADLTYVFYAFVKDVCATCDINFEGETKSATTDFLVIYDQVSTLHVEDTLAKISNFMKRFSQMIDRLEHDANLHFEGWLKKKWALIPLAVGVVLVKIVYYFALPSWSETDATTDFSGSQTGTPVTINIEESPIH